MSGQKLLIVVVIGLFFISCKKDRTCLCQLKTYNQNGGYTETFSEIGVNATTKHKSEEQCLLIQADLEQSTSASVQCGLKY